MTSEDNSTEKTFSIIKEGNAYIKVLAASWENQEEWDKCLSYLFQPQRSNTAPKMSETILLAKDGIIRHASDLQVDQTWGSFSTANEVGLLWDGAIDPKPSVENLCAVVAPTDDFESRLDALHLKLYLLKKYKIDLPVLSLDERTHKLEEFSILHQLNDVNNLMLENKSRFTTSTQELIKQFYSYYGEKYFAKDDEKNKFLIHYIDFATNLPRVDRQQLLDADWFKLVDLKQVNPDGKTLLSLAADNNLDNVIKFLISRQKSSSFNAVNTIAYFIKNKTKLPLIKYLHTKKGMQISSTDQAGNTFLHYASHVNNISLAQYLLANSIDINAKNNRGDTPLHAAIRENQYEFCEFLLKNGADANAQNKNGNSPLHLACKRNPDIAQLLIQHNARLDSPLNHSNQKPVDKILQFDPELLLNKKYNTIENENLIRKQKFQNWADHHSSSMKKLGWRFFAIFGSIVLSLSASVILFPFSPITSQLLFLSTVCLSATVPLIFIKPLAKYISPILDVVETGIKMYSFVKNKIDAVKMKLMPLYEKYCDFKSTVKQKISNAWSSFRNLFHKQPRITVIYSDNDLTTSTHQDVIKKLQRDDSSVLTSSSKIDKPAMVIKPTANETPITSETTKNVIENKTTEVKESQFTFRKR